MAAGESGSSWDDRGIYKPARARHGGASVASPLAVSRKAGSWWRRSSHRRADRPAWTRILLIVAVAFFAVVLVRTFAFETLGMPTSSMGATLQSGDRLLVNEVVYDFRQPRRGEVVVFHGGSTWTPETGGDENSGTLAKLARGFGSIVGLVQPGPHDYVRRVIALPGDTVACCDSSGRVIVNGLGIDEPYVTLNAPVDSPKGTPACNTRRFSPIVVQPGYMFVLGDDRLLSQDSRCRSQVPLDNVVGRAVAVAWPIGRWSSLSTPSSFADVPKPYSLGDLRRIPIAGTDSLLGDAGLAIVFPLTAALSVAARSRGRRRIQRRRLRA